MNIPSFVPLKSFRVLFTYSAVSAHELNCFLGSKAYHQISLTVPCIGLIGSDIVYAKLTQVALKCLVPYVTLMLIQKQVEHTFDFKSQ
jgi:hypothetical protein